MTIDRLIDYNDPDPVRYAFNTRRMLDQVRQLGLLIKGLEADVRPKKKEKPGKEEA